jgi:transcription elongation factor Elf1
MKIKCPTCSKEDMSLISVDETKMNMKVQCNNCGQRYTGYYMGDFELITALKPEIGKLRDLSTGE